MVKYRFEVVLEYPDDMHAEDILDLAHDSIMGEIQCMTLDDLERISSESSLDDIIKELVTSLEKKGFKNFGTIQGINDNRSCTHFLRSREHIIVEAVPEEDLDVIEALSGE